MTAYKEVFDRFIKKLKGDTQFLNYSNLSKDEINEIVDAHLNSLLDRAIDELYSFGLPDFDFYDKDNELQLFNGKLVQQEVSLLSEIMYLNYLKEDINKLHAFGLVLRSSEIDTLFSPANDRKTFIEMINGIELNVISLINNYFSRDRLTWKEKSIYGGMSL